MEIVLAMYGCFLIGCFSGKWIGTGIDYGVLWKLLGIVYGIVIVGCLIYNMLPQQNKKIINFGLINYYSIWTKMGIFELWLHTLPMC